MINLRPTRFALAAAVMAALLSFPHMTEAGPGLEKILLFAAQESGDPEIVLAVQALHSKGFLKTVQDDLGVTLPDEAASEPTIAKIKSTMDSYLKAHKTRAGHGEYYLVRSWSLQSIDWKPGRSEARVDTVVSIRRGTWRSTESLPRTFSVDTETWTIRPIH